LQRERQCQIGSSRIGSASEVVAAFFHVKLAAMNRNYIFVLKTVGSQLTVFFRDFVIFLRVKEPSLFNMRKPNPIQTLVQMRLFCLNLEPLCQSWWKKPPKNSSLKITQAY